MWPRRFLGRKEDSLCNSSKWLIVLKGYRFLVWIQVKWKCCKLTTIEMSPLFQATEVKLIIFRLQQKRQSTSLIFKLLFLCYLSYVLLLPGFSWKNMAQSIDQHSDYCIVNFCKQVLGKVVFLCDVVQWCYQLCFYTQSKCDPTLHSTTSAVLCVTVFVMPQRRQMDQVWTMGRHSCCVLMSAAAALTSISHGMIPLYSITVTFLNFWLTLTSYQAFWPAGIWLLNWPCPVDPHIYLLLKVFWKASLDIQVF